MADQDAHGTQNADSGGGSPRVRPGPPSASTRRSRWPGWIWGIPIAAVLIVGWLAFRQWTSQGPEVTVLFKNAGGIQASNTEVKYHGLTVGSVDSVHLTKKLEQVTVKIRLNGEMEGYLGKGTEFWIANETPSLTNPASLKSIISGPTIDILPRPGHMQKLYHGLSKPPVMPETVAGRHFLLGAGKLGNLSRGAPVYFSGLQVGSVESRTLQPDKHFLITIFIRAPYDDLVHTGTRFWNAGTVQLAMQPNGPQLQLQSVPAIVQGAVDFETPTGPNEGPLAHGRTHFTLYDSKDKALYAPSAMAVTYQVVFPAAAGGLETGAPVSLAGKRIGSVTQSTLEYNRQSGELYTRATLALEPKRIALANGEHWPAKPRRQMDELMAKLISNGLRAELGSAVPLVGSKDVELAFLRGPGQTGLIPGNPPGIPTTKDGAGIKGIITSMNTVAGKLDSLPLERIGANLRTITQRLAALSQSPQLTATLKRLDRSIANIQQVSATAKTQVPGLLKDLRYTAFQADAAVRQVRTILNNQSGVTATGTETAGLTQALYQLTRAAEAIRNLANMIARDPTMFIRGRG